MNTREQNQLNSTILQLQQRGDLFTKQIIYERKRANAFQQELQNVVEKIARLRSENKEKAIKVMNMHCTTTNNAYQKVDGTNPTLSADLNQKKLLKNLESRLNKALLRQTNVQNENDLLKQKIDKVRIKICHDYTSRANMEKKLVENQRKMDFILESARKVAEQIESIKNETKQILAQDQEDEDQYMNELSHLEAFIVEENELLGESIHAATNAFVSMSAVDVKSGGVETNDEEQKLLERIGQLEKEKNSAKVCLEEVEGKIKKYREAFNELHDVSHLSTTDEIAQVFAEKEEEMFAMFNYIQRLSQEHKVIVKQHLHLEEELKDFSKKQNEEEAKRHNVCSKYEKMLKDTQEERKSVIEISNEGKDAVKQIAQLVQKLYMKLRCHALDVRIEQTDKGVKSIKSQIGDDVQNRQKMLKPESYPTARIGDRSALPRQSFLPSLMRGQGVSEKNILRSMELIEKRCVQLISRYEQDLAKSSRPRRPSMLLTPSSLERMNLFRKEHGSLRQDGVVHSLDISTESDESSDYDSDSCFDDNNHHSHAPKRLTLKEIRMQAAARLTLMTKVASR